MATVHESITPELQAWIEAQHLFFVASAPLNAEGHVNVSPKGMDCLRVLDAHTVAYLDMTGSGNETAAHLLENGRITLMWCAFEGAPRILRLYGQGEVILPSHAQWAGLAEMFPPLAGVRQIVLNRVTRVQTSCGYAVPFMAFQSERETLQKYWQVKGEDACATYHTEKNMHSIDGLPTPFTQTNAE